MTKLLDDRHVQTQNIADDIRHTKWNCLWKEWDRENNFRPKNKPFW